MNLLRNSCILCLGFATFAGCGGSSSNIPEYPPLPPAEGSGEQASAARELPPPSGPAVDVHLPTPIRASLPNGLEVNTIHITTSPVVYVRLTVRVGSGADPAARPGLATFVGDMLRQGTRSKDAAALAEAIDFLGADLSIETDEASTTLAIRALADQLDPILDLLSEMALAPRFDAREVTRFKQRETDQLALQLQDPSFLGRREFYRIAFGESHPYAHIGTTAASIRGLTRAELVAFHRANYVPNNAFLVIVGGVPPELSMASANRALGSWQRRDVRQVSIPAPPQRSSREIVIVHRPQSVQSVIAIGNLSTSRVDPNWVPLAVANQVLGGGTASRLFQDLRERRSLTYGAYSSVDDLIGSPGVFRARAAVMNERTEPAMSAFMEHLMRIVAEEPSVEEVEDAKRFLADSFPLSIDTAGRIASMTGYLRLLGLPDDYWDSYRTRIREVTPADALRAARSGINPENAIIVVVGNAEILVDVMRRYGDVRVVDEQGRAVSQFTAIATPPSPTAAQPTAAQPTAAQ